MQEHTNFQTSPQAGNTPQPTHDRGPAPVNHHSQENRENSLPSGPYGRPTLQQMNAAMQFIRLAEEEYSNKRRYFPAVQVSEHEKELYMQQFDQLWRFVQDVEKKLIMYHALFWDEPSTTKLVAIIVTTKEQRKLLATPGAPPQYILANQIVRALLVELHSMMDRFYKAIATMAPGPIFQAPSRPPQPVQDETLAPVPGNTPQPTHGRGPAPVNHHSQENRENPLPSGPYGRPTLQQMNAAMQFIRLAEEEYSNKRRNFPAVQVSEHEKESYMQQFDQLWRFVQDVEKKLIMYHALFWDEPSTTKLVAIIVTTKEQRKLLATPGAPPQYILAYQIVRSLHVELHSMMYRFYRAIATMTPGPSFQAPSRPPQPVQDELLLQFTKISL